MKFNKKIYAIDNGLVHAIAFKISDNFGPLFENIVAIDLLRKEKAFFYYHCFKKEQKEVDFFIPESDDKLIQVCFSMQNEKTRKRELESLQSGMEETGLKESLLLTLDEEEIFVSGGLKINIMPAWKYLSL